MKCKVAILPLFSKAYRLALQAVLFIATRRRKLAADSAFCCQLKRILWIFSAQTKWASSEMRDESRSRKVFSAKC